MIRQFFSREGVFFNSPHMLPNESQTILPGNKIPEEDVYAFQIKLL